MLPIETVLTHCHKHTNGMSGKLLASTKSSTSSGARRLIADWTFLQGSREACDQHDRWKLMLSEISKSSEGQFLQTNHRDLMCSVVMIDHGSPARLFQLFYTPRLGRWPIICLKSGKGDARQDCARICKLVGSSSVAGGRLPPLVSRTKHGGQSLIRPLPSSNPVTVTRWHLAGWSSITGSKSSFIS